MAEQLTDTPSHNSRDVKFLLVEDDDVDIQAMRRAFRKLFIANDLIVVRNGLEALAILRGDGESPQLAPPYIVLLDLNMPKMNGIEFLDRLREDPALKTVVVFVLSTSSADLDRIAAYQRNVAGYIVKQRPEETLMEAIAMIDHYWRVVELP